MNIKSLSKWHQTRLGLIVFAVVELAMAYGFASLAIERGSLWWYLLTIIFLFGTTQNIIRLIGKFIHADKTHKA